MYQMLPEMIMPATMIIPFAILAVNNDADRDYLTQLYLNYRNLIYRVVLTFFPDDYDEAENAFGSTLEKICKQPELIRTVSDSKKAAYIATMAANTCRDLIRRKKQSIYSCSYDDDSMSGIINPVDPYENLFEYSSMTEVIESWESLTDNDRDIIRMRYAEEKTVPEIAAILGVREASIYSALFRARKHLIKQLGKEKNHHEK